MRWKTRSLRLLPVLALGAVLAFTAVAPAVAQSDPGFAITVTAFDNDAPGMTFDSLQAYWGFGPDNIEVEQGDTVQFNNPSSNAHPHTFTNIERVGPPFPMANFRAGTRFDSSPTPDRLVMPGQSFRLDTSTLEPGNYPYLCKLHPWMQGVLTVVDPNAPADSGARTQRRVRR